jgi:hypothetical protein
VSWVTLVPMIQSSNPARRKVETCTLPCLTKIKPVRKMQESDWLVCFTFASRVPSDAVGYTAYYVLL